MSHPKESNELRKSFTAELWIFCSIFLVGLFFFTIHGISWVIPQWKTLRQSVATKCTVLETRIQTKTEKNATLYRPEIRISYTPVPRTEKVVLWTYNVDTLTENGGFTTNRDFAQNVLEQYQPGETYTCWYHPERPEMAVLQREASVWGWYFLAIPVCLMIFGIVGVFWSLRIFTVSQERRAARATLKNTFRFSLSSATSTDERFPTVPDSRLINESPGAYLAFRLPTVFLPSIRLFVLGCFTVLWNLVSWSILVYSLYWTSGSAWEIFHSVVFGVIFCGLGLVFTISVIHVLLTAFGVGPTIFEISDHPIYPGRKYRLMLLQTGTLRYKNLDVALVCEETARFRQGTDTVTSRKQVYTQQLLHEKDFETTPDAPLRREMFVRLPIGAMHSMRLEHNEIVWKIVLRASLVNWPDLFCECPIIVHPFTVAEQDYPR